MQFFGRGMQVIAIGDPVAWCKSVCHVPVPYKTAERVEVKVLGDARYIVLDGDSDPPRRGERKRFDVAFAKLLRPLVSVCCRQFVFLLYRDTGIYYCVNMVMIALTCVVSSIILYISHHYQHEPVPLWARKVCNNRPIDYHVAYFTRSVCWINV